MMSRTTNDLKESFYFKGTNNLGVLLCHGLTCAPIDMYELGEALNKEGYTVKCIEYSGHGSDKENFLNTDVYEWYKDLQGAFDELMQEVDGIYIMGHSMGGTFTVKVAQDYNILGLVTMNAPLIGYSKKILDGIPKDLLTRVLKYNEFVIEVGQIKNLEKIIAPLLVVQGMKDEDRFKISSTLLTTYAKSKVLKRLDFLKSGHLITKEEERYDLFKEIVKFLKEIEKKS